MLAQGAATGDIPSTKPKLPVTSRLSCSLGPTATAAGADHYSILEAVSEASALVRGANGPGSPKSGPTQSIDAPSGNLDRE